MDDAHNRKFTNAMAETLSARIHKALSEEIAVIVAAEAVEAGRRVEARVRELTLKISARVLEKFSMTFREPNSLRIEVDLNATHAERKNVT